MVESGLRPLESGSLGSYLRDSWRFAGQVANGEAAKSQVLCFGDSLVKFGLSPSVLQERTGMPAYNLAAYGGPPAFALHVLDRAVAAGARPRALVLAFHPTFLMLPPASNRQTWMVMSRLSECMDLAVRSRDSALFGELIAGRTLTSFRRRYEIRESTIAALRGERKGDERGRVLAEHRREWQECRGGELLPVEPSRLIVADPADRNLFPEVPGFDAIQASYLKELLGRTAAMRVPVFYLVPPLCGAVQSLREEKGLDARQTELAQNIQNRYSNVTVVDARYSRYPEAAFFDTAHLNARGATRLSHDLGDVVREVLEVGLPRNRDRWVNLPRYREVPADLLARVLGQGRATR
jgi:hypothetical protein